MTPIFMPKIGHSVVFPTGKVILELNPRYLYMDKDLIRNCL